MAGRLANFSGHEIVAILQKHFGFFFVSQRGSHIKLKKFTDGKIITAIVPAHAELAPGTLHNILRQARVDVNDFLEWR